MAARPLHMSPSILAADTADLAAAVAAVQAAGAHSIHVDVMDGHYVANFAFSPKNIDDLRRVTSLPLHAHLEVSDADRCVPLFANADMIIVQEDTTPDLAATIARIRAAGCDVGVGVNPERRLEPVLPLLAQIDLLLLLAVAPGFGGQPFNPVVLDKARLLTEYRAETGLAFVIGVDGGINGTTIGPAAEAGMSLFVAGTGIFGVSGVASDPVAQIRTNLVHLAARARSGPAAE